MRADQLLLQRGLAPTRSAAQRLIASGSVRWMGASGWQPISKTGLDLPLDAVVEVTDDAELRWASRAGLKLEAALARTGLRVEGKQCLDLGQSTGGFTDVLLANGAAFVLGVEVGHGQLHPKLATDSRVRTLEGLDVRDFNDSQSNGEWFDSNWFDLVVGDLSFISQTLVLDDIKGAMKVAGDVLMLVKPQFELQPGLVGKGGIVKSPASYELVERRIRSAYAEAFLEVYDYFESPIQGGDGNREFFVHAGWEYKDKRS